jgi:hypothetical protein
LQFDRDGGVTAQSGILRRTAGVGSMSVLREVQKSHASDIGRQWEREMAGA